MADPRPSGTRLRLALIGAGTISQSVHLPALRRLSTEIELIAVCDASPSRAEAVARREGARGEHDAERLLEREDLDAVLLATPGSHGQLARQALLAGRHVLAEKPLTLTVAEAEELAALAADRGLVLQVGYMKMYDPLIAEARDQLERIGVPRLVRITVLHPADEQQLAHLRMAPLADDSDPHTIAAAHAYDARRTELAVGSAQSPLAVWYRDVLHGSVIHELSLLRALGLGLPERFEQVRVWPWPPDGAPPCLLASASLPEGRRLLLSWNWLPAYPEYEEEVVVLGTAGRVRLQVAPPYLFEARSRLEIDHRDRGLHAATRVRTAHVSGFSVQLEAFLASVRGGAQVLSDARGAAADTRCLQRLAASAAADQGDAPLGGEAGA
ncbi:MAG: Gfo/Idh/MocA family oxidoreductase [Solirubrobacterales bacterium]|nr:Gfo/Idh/MocA family oxidoreductase [Solirubrobacterales bacterium]